LNESGNAAMNIGQIEQNVHDLAANLSRDTFVYDLLSAYGLAKASITRLQHGTYNLSKTEGEILWKKKLYFRAVFDEDLHGFIDTRRKQEIILKHAPRFLVVTDFETLLAYDSKTDDTLDIALTELPRHYDFFLPWAGMEKAQAKLENPADVKAAVKMAQLYDLIRNDNPDRYTDAASLHELNVFLSRLLFCYFAEDTEIFSPKLFTNSVTSHTQPDASDLDRYLNRLFDVLNTPEPTTSSLHSLGTMSEPLNKDLRAAFPEYLKKFPYVNGGLFAQTLLCPKFGARTRKMLIECGRDLNWSDINPDIFGSMMQAVVHPDERGGMGMHYTSVTNIMKVIEPLFLNELREEFDKYRDDARRLQKLIERMRTIRIFDPACGSGNFLIIAYKELRKLEIEAFKRLQEVSEQRSLPISGITLSQFFGIELDDFAHEIAILSLWLAEHQMNVAFQKTFGHARPSLPLKESGNIVHGNALRVDWSHVCPKHVNSPTFILGNPPYQGSKRQSKDQKADMAEVFKGSKTYKNLDYISCWIVIGSRYITGTDARFAFVATNSIVQGDQVSLLWPIILASGQEIFFAHRTFKWGNNAKHEAGVSCVIVGIAQPPQRHKVIFDGDKRLMVNNISPYLTNSENIIVHKRNSSISDLPEMVYGNMPLEGGYLKLDSQEREALLLESPESARFIRPLVGGDEFLSGTHRWCIWIDDDELDQALRIKIIQRRVEQVKEFRRNGGDVARTLVGRSHQFRYRHQAKTNQIIVPCTSSERREYLQCGLFDAKYVTLNSAQVIYDPDLYVFGIISSRMHMIWTKATAGCLESRIRYSALICYNTFPFPKMSETSKKTITSAVFEILEARENRSELTAAQLYDPLAMPPELRRAHTDLDAIVERCFRPKPFLNDEERLEYLLTAYTTLASKNEGEADA
jgi:N-6 DNA Methylase